MLITHIPMMQDSMKDTVGNASGRMVVTNDSNAGFYPNEVGGPLGHYFRSLNTAAVFDTNYPYLEKFSLAFWFCPTYAAAGDWAKIIGIGEVAYNNNGQNNNNRIRLELNSATSSDSQYYGFFGNALLNNYSGALGSIGKSSYPAGTWVHLILTFEILDSSNVETKFYVNNVLKTTLKIAYTEAPRGNLIIGGDLTQQTSSFADVRVYNHILSDYERDEIYRKRLVCHYCFDSVGNTMQAKDLSTMDNDATACTALVSQYNKIGYTCAQFDGSHYVTLPASLKLTDKFTCNFWAYMEDWIQYTGMRLISSTESGGWNIEDSGDNIRMSCYDGIAKAYKTTGFYAKSKLTSGWHMFTCQFDGSYARLFVDAAQVAISAQYNNAPNGQIGYNVNNRIFLGCEAGGNANPASSYFKGKLDDFKVYASALTVEDLQKEYSVRAHIDNNCKLFTKWLNEVEVGYSKYNLISGVQSIGAGTTQKSSPDMNFYEFASGGNPIVWYTTKIKPKPNHKYYASIVWRTLAGFTVGDNRFEWWSGDGANQNMIFAYKGNTNGNAVKVSSIQSLSAVADGDWRMRNFLVNGSAKAWTSDPILVDLTEIFGAGNEPDVKWCDKNIIFDPVNLISDPSFENHDVKNAHSSARYGDVVDYDAYEGNNSLEIASDSGSEMTCGLGYISNFRPMHRYYWGAWVKRMAGTTPATGNCYMQPQAGTAESFQGNFPYGPADGNWYYCSFITRDACFTHNNYKTTWNEIYGQSTVRLDLDGLGKVRYDCLQQIDLTALYGWGNEPTLAECDKLFGYKNANIQFCDEKGVTNINQISEMGRPMRYLRISTQGSSANAATNHIVQLDVQTVDNGKIRLLDAVNNPDNKMKGISGINSFQQSTSAPYWNIAATAVFDMGKVDFVASVWMQRYYHDNRYYYQTKLEGSLDNSTWFTIWDSHNKGSYGSDNAYNTYAETEAGRTFIVEADKVYMTTGGTLIVNEIEEY